MFAWLIHVDQSYDDDDNDDEDAYRISYYIYLSGGAGGYVPSKTQLFQE